MKGSIWYNVRICYEQCGSGHEKDFVVLAHKKSFSRLDS